MPRGRHANVPVEANGSVAGAAGYFCWIAVDQLTPSP